MYSSESSNEPYGLRLARLIHTQMSEITRREGRNTDRMRLYNTNGYWTAFDRSAYFLSQVCPAADIFVVEPPGYPFTVVGATVSEKELQSYADKHIVHRQEPDYLEFLVKPDSSQKYNDWHRKVEVFYA